MRVRQRATCFKIGRGRLFLGGGVGEVDTMSEPGKREEEEWDKRDEQDIELLRNRIRKLRAEESKAAAKVSEAQRRQEEVLAVRARHEQAVQQRAGRRLDEEEKVRRQREAWLSQKRQSRVAIKQRLDQMYSQRREVAVKLKQEGAQHEQALRSARDREVALAQRSAEQISQHEKALQAETARRRQAQQQVLIQDFLRLIAQEEGRKAELEAEIRDMALQEAAEAETLRALKEELRESMDELELTLAESPQAHEPRRYFDGP